MHEAQIDAGLARPAAARPARPAASRRSGAPRRAAAGVGRGALRRRRPRPLQRRLLGGGRSGGRRSGRFRRARIPRAGGGSGFGDPLRSRARALYVRRPPSRRRAWTPPIGGVRRTRLPRAGGRGDPFPGRRIGHARRVDADQHRADGEHVADRPAERDDRAGDRRRDLDRRLVGHHRSDDLILPHHVADLDMPFDDFGLGDAFADIGHPDRAQAHSGLHCRDKRPADTCGPRKVLPFLGVRIGRVPAGDAPYRRLERIEAAFHHLRRSSAPIRRSASPRARSRSGRFSRPRRRSHRRRAAGAS